MNESNKSKILQKAAQHINAVVSFAAEERDRLSERLAYVEKKLKRIAGAELAIELELRGHKQKRHQELSHLAQSPYFMRLDAKFTEDQEPQTLYIGKYNIIEKNIYSWVAPISAIRFGQIGPAAYDLPKGGIRTGELSRKDQFMIVEGKIVFMASESLAWARTLIYQEKLSQRKKDFILPEIIEKMEKSQDEVIRADYPGSFLISGPAGSGKTTLALHRVAYLVQSPDTSANFPSHNIVVFVQDSATKEYFSALLPQLGINDVNIHTFPDWAISILGLNGYKHIFRYGNGESEKDFYEYYKNQALAEIQAGKDHPQDTHSLFARYRESFPEGWHDLLRQQNNEKVLDRFDLVLLLQGRIKQEGGLSLKKRVILEDKRGVQKVVDRHMQLEYALVIIDEAENYLPEQISIIKQCLNANQSIIYAGDLAQQTSLFTIKAWEQAGEDFSSGRRVELEKVYRSTRQILDYISAQGYDITIPEGLGQGAEAIEKKWSSPDEARSLIARIISDNSGLMTGVLCAVGSEIEDLRQEYKDNDNVRVLTINEAQGVEFDLVILLKIGKPEASDYPSELIREKTKVFRDLEYVALTRAMSKLYVLARE